MPEGSFTGCLSNCLPGGRQQSSGYYTPRKQLIPALDLHVKMVFTVPALVQLSAPTERFQGQSIGNRLALPREALSFPPSLNENPVVCALSVKHGKLLPFLLPHPCLGRSGPPGRTWWLL